MDPKEKAVRDAAASLQTAVIEARAAGYYIDWPRRFEDLAFIAISETGKSKVSITVAAPAGTDPVVVAQAAQAAQEATDGVGSK